MKAKTKTLQTMHTHMLLWNLKAMENSAIHAPPSVRAGYVRTRDELAPHYRAELQRRGVEYPRTLDEADWEIALARAMGFDQPQPRKIGRRDPDTGKILELVQVWDGTARAYVVRQ